MKTVAVCISGQFRSFDKCLPSIFSNLILTNSKYELKFFTSFAKEENKPINIPTEFSAMRADTPYADGGVASMFSKRPG